MVERKYTILAAGSHRSVIPHHGMHLHDSAVEGLIGTEFCPGKRWVAHSAGYYRLVREWNRVRVEVYDKSSTLGVGPREGDAELIEKFLGLDVANRLIAEGINALCHASLTIGALDCCRP